MKIKDYIMLVTASLLLGWLLVSFHNPHQRDPLAIGEIAIPQIDTPTVVNVKDKTALYIGDSHTANHNAGWQVQLSKAVGFKMINASVGGKTTYWMLETGHLKINDDIDYCFVYGGANDMYSNHITPQEAVDNIKAIARICKGRGIKCIVLTGFDAFKCTRTGNGRYPFRYKQFQELLLTDYMDGAIVIDTRVVDRRDCWDNLCHMAPSGHKKIAEKIIKDLALQRI